VVAIILFGILISKQSILTLVFNIYTVAPI